MAKRQSRVSISVSPSLIALRLVLVSSIVTIIPPLSRVAHLLADRVELARLCTTLATAVHHAGSAFGPKRFPLKIWMDVLLTALEVGFQWFFAVNSMMKLIPPDPESAGPISRRQTISLIFTLASAVSLSVMLVFRAADALRLPGRRWSDSVDVSKVSQDPWWRYPTLTVFGRELWVPTVPGESGWLSVTRGMLALLSIGLMAAFGIYQVVLSPIAEIGVTRYKQFRARGLAGDHLNFDMAVSGNWTVVVMWHEHTSASKALADTVLIDWSYRIPRRKAMTLQPSVGRVCDIEADLADGFYQCYQATPNRSTLTASLLATSLLSIHIQINFTELFSPDLDEDPLRSEPLAALNAVYIYVGLVAETFDPFTSGTRPIPLFPGTHMLSVVERVARQSIKESSLAILGFESYDVSIIMDPVYTIHNPSANSSDSMVGTLTVAVEDFGSKHEWIVLQDFRNKSILAGLSVVGGLGAFLSTLFAIFVGTSLMTALVRTKPYSPFGMLHSAMADQMAQASREMYPQLDADIERVRQNPGVVVFLFDTMIDMEPLGYCNVNPSTGKPELAENEQVSSGEHDEESVELVSRESQIGFMKEKPSL